MNRTKAAQPQVLRRRDIVGKLCTVSLPGLDYPSNVVFDMPLNGGRS